MLTEQEIERLAEALTQKQTHRTCPLGLTSSAVAMVNAMAQAWETGKKTAIKTAVGIFVTAMIGLIVAGIIEKLRHCYR